MKLGTHVRLPDGREGTVVFNSLIGVGIKWGIHYPDPADFEGSSGNLVPWEKPADWFWEPDVLLREPSKQFPNLFAKYGFQDADCMGQEFEIMEAPDD